MKKKILKKPFSILTLEVQSNQNKCTCPKWLGPNDQWLEGAKARGKEEKERKKRGKMGMRSSY